MNEIDIHKCYSLFMSKILDSYTIKPGIDGYVRIYFKQPFESDIIDKALDLLRKDTNLTLLWSVSCQGFYIKSE